MGKLQFPMAKTAVLALSILACVVYYPSTVLSSRSLFFRKSEFCLSTTCAKEKAATVQSVVECARKCSEINACSGFEYNPTQSFCSLLKLDCFSNVSCPYDDPGRSVYEVNTNGHGCLNHGSYNDSIATCRCVDGWVGRTCERRPYNCKELYDFWYPDGSYSIIMDVARDQSLLPVTICYIRRKTSTTIIFRNTGRLLHDKSWQSFMSGYTIDTRNMWLGLENIRALNRMGNTAVFFKVILRQSEEKNWNRRYHHSDFQISDAKTGYSFTVDPGVPAHSGTDPFPNEYALQDVLTLCAGRSFLTPDNDNPQNCSQQAGTGWWFPDCTNGITVNPLGYLETSSLGPPGSKTIHVPGYNMSDEKVQSRFISAAMAFRTVH